jgi:hypothetical protein
MVELYCRLIREGVRTIDQVPERYRTEVQAMLDAV